MSNKPVEIVVIADRSGSMHSIRTDAIGGFNSFLAEQQALPGKANLTLVLFDDQYEVPVESADIQNVAPLTEATFVPRGLTAMNDAIGRAVVTLNAKAPEKAIICILTDGLENASKEYNNAQIKELIEGVNSKGWEVVFLAANQDAFAAGGQRGFAAASCNNFDATAEGTRSAYRSMSLRASNYRSS